MIANEFMNDRNRRKIEEFLGLSPEEMQILLHYPSDDCPLFRWSERAEPTGFAIAIGQADDLLTALTAVKAKATSTGRLPQSVLNRIRPDPDRRDLMGRGRIGSETDWPRITLLRTVLTDLRLMRKYKGVFVTTKKGEAALANGWVEAYPALCRYWFERVNWGFLDSYPESTAMQYPWRFSLLLIRDTIADWTRADQIALDFVRAFPMVIDDMARAGETDPGSKAQTVYELRFLERVARPLGLVESRSTDEKDKRYLPALEYRALPILEDLFQSPLRLTRSD